MTLEDVRQRRAMLAVVLSLLMIGNVGAVVTFGSGVTTPDAGSTAATDAASNVTHGSESIGEADSGAGPSSSAVSTPGRTDARGLSQTGPLRGTINVGDAATKFVGASHEVRRGEPRSSSGRGTIRSRTRPAVRLI
ncbi:hypothetical protein SAMN05443636_1031 [Halobaculum gomorrense]|uniref:Uncharacterized protein n=1 Tax=Halobaculum gomorrense TaxID=43928 RepID=A0A1M5MKL7_9EURY|nr:hypothetical protein SAMN05443636_1031 [Halobaculum gomorrense]